MSDTPNSLQLNAVIGFRGDVQDGLILHPNDTHVIYSLGSTVIVRDVINCKQEFLTGHDNVVNALALSGSGSMIASGQRTHMGFQADIIVWDFETRQEKFRLKLHKVMVRSMHFSPSEQYLVSLGGQDDNSIVCWNMQTGEPICGTPAFSDTAYFCRFFNTADNEFRLISGGNKHIRLWNFDVANKKLRPTEVKTFSKVRMARNCDVDHDDEYAYVGTSTGDVLQIALQAQIPCVQHSYPKMGHLLSAGISNVKIIPDGSLVIASGDGVVRRLRIRDGEMQMAKGAECKVHGGITSITPTQDSTYMFVGTNQSNMYWVDTSSLTAELKNTCHTEGVTQIAFAEGCSSVFGTAAGSDIRLWNTAKRQELVRIVVPNRTCLAMDFAKDGTLIVSGWDDGKIRAFMPESGKKAFEINDSHRGGCTALCTTHDGKIVSGGFGGEVRVWASTQSHHMEASLKEHTQRVNRIIMHASLDYPKAVSASADGSVIVWDLVNQCREMCIIEPTNFKSVVFHPDMSQLVTCGADRKVSYWDATNGECIREREGTPHGDLNGMCITKSGSAKVTVGFDREVKLWDYDSGEITHTGVGHSGSITNCAISPDQRTIVSVGEDNAIFLWKMPAEEQERAVDMCLVQLVGS